MQRRGWIIGSAASLVGAALLVATVTCDSFITDSKGGAGPIETANASALAGLPLHAEPDSRALRTVTAWRGSRPDDAALIERLASTPQGVWFNGWQPDPRAAVSRLATAANDRGSVPLVVVYNIPARDCGEHSAGGAASAAAYHTFVSAIADGLRGRKSIVVLEPDAIAGADCLPAQGRTDRMAMIRAAVRTLAGAGAWVYIDAGHSGWHSPSEIAARLQQAGIADATGFAINVSNFITTSESVGFGDALSRLVGGKHYVLDTSRNGLGPFAAGVWCNPDGRAVGRYPTTTTGYPLVDGLLWVKNPGDSDGPCNGGPAAGEWWPEYALGLMRRAPATP